MNHHAVRQMTVEPRANRSPYRPPADVFSRPLREVLLSSARNHLEPKQLSLLDQGSGASAKSTTLDIAGNLDLLFKPCIAVIGARKVSDLGRRRARQFARQLADRDIVVVSGLAEGVDTEALEAAIEAGGKVIGVIGTPIDKAYPAKNKALQEAIYRDHLLVSQFPRGTRTFPSSFPARNRTMAALSDASVVIEASDTSGTLHQAAECQRLGRWLGISKSVADDPGLSWPAKFLGQPRTAILETTEQFLSQVYGVDQ